MSKKLDPRIPKDSGSKSLTNYAALCSPWNHLVGYQEASTGYRDIMPRSAQPVCRHTEFLCQITEKGHRQCAKQHTRNYIIQ